MGNEIYCYGGIDIYNAVFNAIAMMNGDRSFIQSMVAIGILVGGFWTMATLIFGDFIKPFLHWIIPMAVLQAAFLTPTATVHLIDVVQEGRHEVVDHVPYGLALIAGSLSRISQRITEKTELYFHSVDDIKYSKTGGIFAANLLENQGKMTIQDEDFAENMRSFIGHCVLYDVALGRKYTLKQLLNTHNIWRLVSANASPARSFMWKERQNRGEIVTCAEGVQRFNASWGTHVDHTACAVGSRMYPNHDAIPYLGGNPGRSFQQAGACKSPLARAELLKFLPFQYAALAGIGQQGPEILKQQMMITAVVDAQDHASMIAGNAPNFAARKAYLQQRSSYQTIGKLASDTLPIMRAVLELICYALFLFIIPILVLPMGYKVLVNWTQTVLWLAMWPPMYAVLHLIMVSAIGIKTRAHIGISNSQGITIASSLGVQNISADMAAMAGYLSMSIPFICISIVKGVSSFVHMAGSLGAVSQGAASSAATESLTGNHSLGNTSMDNHSFGNMNQLSQNYTSSLSTGNTSLQEGHSTYATDANGNMVAKEQRHDLGVSVNMARSLSDQKRTSAIQEHSVGQNLMQSSERSVASAFDDLVTTRDSLSSTERNEEGVSKQQQQEYATSMGVVTNTIEKFAKEHGITTTKAAQVMAHAGTSGALQAVLGVSASTDMTSSHEDREMISKAKDLIKSTDFNEHASVTAQAMQHISKSSSDETVRDHAKSHQASVNQANRDSTLAQKHFDRSDRLIQEADRVDSNALNINRDATVNYVSWLEKQPGIHSNGGNYGAMGQRAALNVLKSPEHGSLYESQYMREHMPTSSITATPASLKQKHDETHIASTQNPNILKEADQAGRGAFRHDVEKKVSGLEADVHTKMNETQQTIDREGDKQTTAPWRSMEKEHQEKAQSSGIVEAVSGAYSTISGTATKTMNAGFNAAHTSINYIRDHGEDIAMMNPIMPLSVVQSRMNERSLQAHTIHDSPEKSMQSDKSDDTRMQTDQTGIHRNGGNYGTMERQSSLNVLKKEHGNPYESKSMREHMPASSITVTPQPFEQTYDNTQISSTQNPTVLNEVDRAGRSTITHDLDNKGRGLEQVVDRKENKAITQAWNATQNEYEGKTQNVGIVQAAYSAVGAAPNGRVAGEEASQVGITYAENKTNVTIDSAKENIKYLRDHGEDIAMLTSLMPSSVVQSRMNERYSNAHMANDSTEKSTLSGASNNPFMQKDNQKEREEKTNQANNMQNKNESNLKNVGSVQTVYEAAENPLNVSLNSVNTRINDARDHEAENSMIHSPASPASVHSRMNEKSSMHDSPEKGSQSDKAVDTSIQNEQQQRKTVKIIKVNAKEEPEDLKELSASNKSTLKD